MKARSMLKICGIALLLLFGGIRLSFEQALTETHRAAYFNNAKLNIDLRQQLGQMGLLAALSGFRAAVADVLWIEANSAWQRTEWGRLKLLLDTVTSLQPRALLFWDTASWHMAYNASYAAFENKAQPRQALRIKAQREYFRLGEDFLLRGIQNNPERPLLYDRLGMLYRDKFGDHARAAQAYKQCAALPKAPQYAARFAAYELSQVPGHEQDAYDQLIAFYRKGKQEHLPTLIRRLRELEEKLKLPAEQRIQSPVTPP